MFNRQADLESEETNVQPRRSENLSEESTETGVCHSLENQFHKRPITSVLTAFGLGLGAGALVGCFLLRQRENSTQSAVGSFGAQMKESLSGAVPDSIKQYFRD
jgi:hypothetical protein